LLYSEFETGWMDRVKKKFFFYIPFPLNCQFFIAMSNKRGAPQGGNRKKRNKTYHCAKVNKQEKTTKQT
jgi:hypothetical protein